MTIKLGDLGPLIQAHKGSWSLPSVGTDTKSHYHEKKCCLQSFYLKDLMYRTVISQQLQPLSKTVWNQRGTPNKASEEMSCSILVLLGQHQRKTSLQHTNYSSSLSPWNAPSKSTIFLAAFKEIYLKLLSDAPFLNYAIDFHLQGCILLIHPWSEIN